MRNPEMTPSAASSSGQRYRTKIEVLRAILESTAAESTKTRILRRANLNPVSFERYLAFCVGTGLVEPAGRRFRRTVSGDAAMVAIDSLIGKAAELGSAMQQLGSCLGSEAPPVESTAALRFASLAAWDELARWSARSGGVAMPSRRALGALGPPGVGPSHPGAPRRPRLVA
jgi:predicted transcriptional regulator